jgi:hypothetical protein
MSNSPLFFMSPECGACKSQKKLLNDYYLSTGKTATINMVNVDQYPGRFNYVKALPTWLIPLGNGKSLLTEGIIQPEKLMSFGKKKKKGYLFGNTKTLYPGINDRDYYGKDFPNGKGFNIPPSFSNDIESKWGKGQDALNAGVGTTRNLTPGNLQEVYSSNNLNNIRMAHPSDQLGSSLYLNRNCNVQKNPTTQSVGMVSNSGSPQIVDNTTNFGRNRSRFGTSYLYRQMGPAYAPYKSGYIDRGARQNEGPRPNKVNSDTYISQAPEYSFGKKKITLAGKKSVNIYIKQVNASGKKRKQ